MRVEFGDGDHVEIPAPVLWSDEITEKLHTGQQEAAYRLMNGDDRWERFVAAGGSWRVLAKLWDDSAAPAEPSPGE